MKSIMTWLIVLGSAIFLAAQRATFHAVTRLVQVPVEVFNSHGKFVPGLTKTDFQLRINGKFWPIANLDIIRKNVRAASSISLLTHQVEQWRNGIFSNHIHETPRNRIVFLFDMTHIPRMARAQLQLQINRILQKPIPGNEDIAVLEENPGLIELQSFTQNRQLLHSAINRIGYYHTKRTLASVYRSLGGLYGGEFGGDAEPLQGAPLAPVPEPNGDQALVQNLMTLSELMGQIVSIQQYYGTIDTLNMISRMLSNVPGHKEILWFTNDTDYTAPGNPNLMLSGKRLRHLIRILNNANISLFPIDPDGLSTFAGDEGPGYTNPNYPGMGVTSQGIDPNMLMTHNLASAGAATFATRTGGRAYSDFNSISQILSNAQRYWNAGYVLYFHPPQASNSKSRYYNIQVRVLRSGIHATYRRGFYLRNNSYRPRQLNRQALRKLAVAPMDWHGLPLTIQLKSMGPPVRPQWKPTYPGEKIRHESFKLRLPMKLLLHHLPHRRYGYDFTLQIFTINSQNGAVSFLMPNRFHAVLAIHQAKALRSQKNYYRSAFIVDNGKFYMGRVILRDNYSHRIGSVTVPLNAMIVSKLHH